MLGRRDQVLAREESWQDVERRSAKADTESIANTSFSFNSQAFDDMFPLKTVADRISTRVEQFAEKVDDWMIKVQHARNTRPEIEPGNERELALQLLNDLHEVSKEELALLQQRRQSPDLSRTWRRRVNEVAGLSREGSVVSDAQGLEEPREEVKELAQANEESNTWDLLGGILDLRFPSTDVRRSKLAYEESRGPVTETTEPLELFERFMFLDDAAREKKIILSWLESCAQNGDSDFEKVAKKLEEKGGVSKGHWSRGWMETREALKAAKRSGAARFDPKPRAPDQGGLVTKLDPDVVAREGASLKPKDAFIDRSLWLSCFAMLRQGRSWEGIRGWLEDSNEGWRAASIGRTGDESNSRIFVDDPYAGSLFRRTCFAAAQNTSADIYERAVYGLLAGDFQSVEPACRTWDDYLYAHYNSLFVAAFEDYLQRNCAGRVPSSLTRRFPMPAALENRSNAQIIDIVNGKKVSHSSDTLKRVQSAVIAGTLANFANELGVAMAAYANPKPTEMTTPLIKPTDVEAGDGIWEIMDDYNAVRVIVHILILWETLAGRLYATDPDARYHVESIFVFYINFLRLIGKTEAIPAYAGFITPGRRELVVGYMLADITDRHEQKTLVELIASDTFSTPMMVSYQIERALTKASLRQGEFETIDGVDILEPTALPRWPGNRVSKNFALSPTTDEEERILRACEWYNYVSSPWKSTFENLTEVMKAFLLSGRWSAAIELTKRVPFHDISVAKSGIYFNKSSGIDVFNPDDEEALLAEGPEEHDSLAPEPTRAHALRRSTRATSRAISEQPSARPERGTRKEEVRQHSLVLEVLREQSRQYMEMQQLADVLEHLSGWRTCEEGIMKHMSDKSYVQAFRDELDELEAAIGLLLTGDFMGKIINEDEQADFSSILRAYFPPVLLAYMSALVFSSTYLGPEILLKAMELANAIASEPTTSNPKAPDNSQLASALVSAGKMRDVVEALALASRMLLKLNQEIERKEQQEQESGGKKKRKRTRKAPAKKRGWMGETLDLWDITRTS